MVVVVVVVAPERLPGCHHYQPRISAHRLEHTRRRRTSYRGHWGALKLARADEITSLIFNGNKSKVAKVSATRRRRVFCYHWETTKTSACKPMLTKADHADRQAGMGAPDDVWDASGHRSGPAAAAAATAGAALSLAAFKSGPSLMKMETLPPTCWAR